ncbi:MAG: aspartate/glutamate racemase family protein [Chryseobacterium sp.]|nr:aspartate/glutamate racemase family protein [Chryseobacterium sp.]
MSLKGILGLGAYSTQYYLGEIQRKFKERNKEFSTCPYLLYQIDFQEINPFLPDQFLILKPKVELVLNEIYELGISNLLVPNITLHETLDQIETPVKLYHPVNLAMDHLVKNRISNVTVFGTLYTMNSQYLRKIFSENNIEIMLPSNKDQKWLDDFRKAVFEQNCNENQIKTFQDLITEYSHKNPVLISCTELSVFAFKNNPDCIDMADLQIEEFLK